MNKAKTASSSALERPRSTRRLNRNQSPEASSRQRSAVPPGTTYRRGGRTTSSRETSSKGTSSRETSSRDNSSKNTTPRQGAKKLGVVKTKSINLPNQKVVKPSCPKATTVLSTELLKVPDLSPEQAEQLSQPQPVPLPLPLLDKPVVTQEKENRGLKLGMAIPRVCNYCNRKSSFTCCSSRRAFLAKHVDKDVLDLILDMKITDDDMVEGKEETQSEGENFKVVKLVRNEQYLQEIESVDELVKALAKVVAKPMEENYVVEIVAKNKENVEAKIVEEINAKENMVVRNAVESVVESVNDQWQVEEIPSFHLILPTCNSQDEIKEKNAKNKFKNVLSRMPEPRVTKVLVKPVSSGVRSSSRASSQGSVRSTKNDRITLIERTTMAGKTMRDELEKAREALRKEPTRRVPLRPLPKKELTKEQPTRVMSGGESPRKEFPRKVVLHKKQLPKKESSQELPKKQLPIMELPKKLSKVLTQEHPKEHGCTDLAKSLRKRMPTIIDISVRKPLLPGKEAQKQPAKEHLKEPLEKKEPLVEVAPKKEHPRPEPPIVAPPQEYVPLDLTELPEMLTLAQLPGPEQEMIMTQLRNRRKYYVRVYQDVNLMVAEEAQEDIQEAYTVVPLMLISRMRKLLQDIVEKVDQHQRNSGN